MATFKLLPARGLTGFTWAKSNQVAGRSAVETGASDFVPACTPEPATNIGTRRDASHGRIFPVLSWEPLKFPFDPAKKTMVSANSSDFSRAARTLPMESSRWRLALLLGDLNIRSAGRAHFSLGCSHHNCNSWTLPPHFIQFPNRKKCPGLFMFYDRRSERLRKALRAANEYCYPLTDFVLGSTLRSGFVFLLKV